MCIKFEVDTFSNCINIKGKTPNIWELPYSLGHASGWDFMMGFGKPHQPADFEVAIFSRCRNIKGKPLILGSSPNPRPRPLFLGCDFMMGLGKPKLHTKFEFASFSRCRNIKGEPHNFRELP